MSYTYTYPRPAVTTDVVLLCFREGAWQVLLIQRRNSPFQDYWALPGGFLDEDEAPDAGAARELKEETGIVGIGLHPLGFWGAPGRDPRGHTVSLAFRGVCRNEKVEPVAQDDARDAGWFPLSDLPSLAFDHAEIIEAARLAQEE